MKNIKFLIISLGFLFISSCQDQFDINHNPDRLTPEQMPLAGELTGAVTGVAASTGSYFAIIGGFWAQHFTQSASSNQYKTIDDYSLGTGEMNGAWQSMYNALLDIKNVKQKAQTKGNWNYYLMATVMEAYAYQILTDFYGPVPFKEATNKNILNPKFNTEEEIYDELVLNLKDALSKDLSTSNKEEIPGVDDLIFGGKMTKWTDFANTLLLKLYIRQTVIRPQVAEAGIKELLTKKVKFLSENAAITQYINAPDRSNPLYESDRRQLNTGINLRASRTLFSYLEEHLDTRMPSFYDNPKGPSQIQGDYDNHIPNNINATVIKLTAIDPVYFISVTESYFLQAEADLRYNSGANTKNLYDNGVKEAFTQFKLNGTTFVATGGAYEYPTAGTFDSKLTAIITQKWISFFPGKGYEGFFDQNRTNIPAISNVPQNNLNYVPSQFSYSIMGKTSGKFPKRIVYPQTETQTNANAPALESITTPVWYSLNYVKK